MQVKKLIMIDCTPPQRNLARKLNGNKNMNWQCDSIARQDRFITLTTHSLLFFFFTQLNNHNKSKWKAHKPPSSRQSFFFLVMWVGLLRNAARHPKRERSRHVCKLCSRYHDAVIRFKTCLSSHYLYNCWKILLAAVHVG